MGFRVSFNKTFPFLDKAFTPSRKISKELADRFGDCKVRVWVEAHLALHVGNIFNTKGRAVSCRLACDFAVKANDGSHVDEGRFLRRIAGLGQRLYKTVNVVVAILNINDIPATGAHLGVDVLIVREIDRAIASDLVVVVHDGQIVQFPVSSQRNRFKTNTLLETGVAYHAPGVVVDNIISRAIIGRRQVLCRHRQTNCVCDALP